MRFSRLSRAMAAGSLTAIVVASVRAQVPRTIPFQGQLKTSNGQSVSGARAVTFTLYDTSSNAVGWSENQALTLVNGAFSTMLGSVTPFPAAVTFAQPYLVGVKVGSDPEMTPRIALASVPYALALPNVTVSTTGNVGIGTATPGYPLNFAATVGDKISLYGQSGTHFGFGIQNGLLQEYTDSVNGDIAFGYGSSAAFTERVRIKGNGSVGVNVVNPTERLQVGGRIAFVTNAGDQADAGKLDYRGFDSTSMSIVGAGTSGLNRNLRVYDSLTVGFSAPSGAAAAFNGNVGIGTASPATKLDIEDSTYPSATVASTSVTGSWLNLSNTSPGGGIWHLISTGSGNGEGAGKLIVASGGANGVASENMTFLPSGYVGIGTSSPQTALDVAGIARVHRVQVVGGSDVAEPYSIAPSHGVKPAPGMVVCIDPDHTGKMRISTDAYDSSVAGIISGANGVNPGMTLTQDGTAADGDVPVANVGRVWCYVDAGAGGPVKPGDLLTTSSTPGHAMKAADRDRREGAILGKAMSRLDAGRGLVLVLVGLQ